MSIQDSKVIFFKNPQQINADLSLEDYSKVFILTDDIVAERCLPELKDMIRLNSPIIVKINHGEQHKSIETCQKLWGQLLEQNADRKSVFINLGGGVVGDLGGFIASTYKRGIDYIQVPTTLLAMVDATIGSKTGIDFGGYKNVIGTFKESKAVVVNTKFLDTLPEVELKSGFAEIIKHALIADENYWKEIQQIDFTKNIDWDDIVKRSVEIKETIVKQDPFENGIRKALNFGHTIGHAIESYRIKNGLMTYHGHCVVAGMVCALFLSNKKIGLSQSLLRDLSAQLKKWYPDTLINHKMYDELIRLVKNDKKNERGQVMFTLLSKIGQPLVNQPISDQEIIEALDFYQTVYDKQS